MKSIVDCVSLVILLVGLLFVSDCRHFSVFPCAKKSRNMAAIKSPISVVIGFLIILCSVQHSLQDCDRPTDLDSNIIITPDQSTYATWESFVPSCITGYDKKGPDKYFCQSLYDGTLDHWEYDTSPATLSCSEGAVPCPKPNFTDSAVVITPEQDSYDTYDTVTASCLSGTLQGDDVGVCLSDGTWDFTTEPSCLIDCQAPSNTNGTGSYAHASEVTFSCFQGFSLSTGGDYVAATCDDGAWAPPFTCESFGCSPPSVPSKVTIEEPQSDMYKLDSKVTLKCTGNRTLSGPGFSYCNETGQWDPDPMTIKCRDQCETPSFDDPRIIHTSQLSGSSGQSFYDHTDTIRFSCEGGIFVDGPWKAACHNGTWFPRIDTAGYLPVCRDNCTAPENMLNAGAVFQHTSSHVFECDGTPGKVRMGGPTSFCINGVWTPRIRCAVQKDLRSEL